MFSRGDRHFTAETLFNESRTLRHPPTLATIYNALRDFAACGLLREIAFYGARTWYDTKTGPHCHFYIEQRDELLDIREDLIRNIDVQAPPGMRVVGVDVVIRLEPE